MAWNFVLQRLKRFSLGDNMYCIQSRRHSVLIMFIDKLHCFIKQFTTAICIRFDAQHQ
ncbi:hypothetical protein ECEPECA12_1331 [Escherichia coli EPECa12]|nr:hypothetical protein CV83906_3943 [Escherichia coli]EHV79094.1 hypothetical protein ECDEC7A_2209 [Escherichia coli DEC7A]EHV92120.1 hypothetical protein ECDEC7D_2376 [Escherichia coli DEC7D]EHW01672.1 hypothetical protein ECDEC7E_2196 [Escherichia coli DEC7E]EIQ65440.1 hypothetical protein ECEPECA12_1331 [Escherichia coli EPECa12]